MTEEYTLDYCKKIARDRDGECLSNEFKNKSRYLKWKCNKDGYIWDAPLDRIIGNENKKRKGTWCKKCAGQAITIEECKAIGKKKGGECLSDEFINIDTKLKWECGKCFYIWKTTLRCVKKSGSWCPDCAGNVKLTIDYCNKLVEGKGKCMETKYVNNRTKMKWKCSVEDHEIFEKDITHIRRGHWCGDCSNKTNITLQYCKDFAKEKDGECLSDEYITNRILMKWKCNVCNHPWENSFDHIKAGQWCPKCARNDKSENMLRDLLEKYTNKKFPNVRPDFLKNNDTGQNLELDCYCHELKIAFEYHGRQHYEFVPDFFHKNGIEEYFNQQYRDSLKYELCMKNNIKLIIIPYRFQYRNMKLFEDYVKLMVKELKIEFKKEENIQKGNMSKEGYTLEDCHKLAKDHKIKCLSKEFINIDTPMLWNCFFNHKSWEASYKEVEENGNKCFECKTNRKFTIEDCNKYAENHNGECLSKEYVKNKGQLEWKCNKCKNTWSRSFYKIRDIGYFCKSCDLAIEVKEPKEQVAKYKCGNCDHKPFIRKSHYDDHVNACKGILNYNCIPCNKPFSTQSKLRRHEKCQAHLKKVKELEK